MSSFSDDAVKIEAISLRARDYTYQEIAEHFGIGKSTVGDFFSRITHKVWWDSLGDQTDFIGPKILFIDIETAPIKAFIWRQFQNFIPLEMVDSDWYILAFCAKWAHEKEVTYEDKRASWEDEDDLTMLETLWDLLDEADIVVGQNSKRFDIKKINARFLSHGMQPPSSYRQVDTLEEAKKSFGFTSNKLAWMTEKYCTVYKKLDHEKFPGFKLWDECLKGNPEAWDEMEAYNIHDVLSLEELYGILLPWMKSHPNVNLYYPDNTIRCRCGGTDFEHDGYVFTNLSKFDRFRCLDCGAENRGRVNLLPKAKRASLRMNVL